MVRKFILSAAAAALAAAPLAAEAAAPARTSSPVAETEEISTGLTFVLGLLLFGLLVLIFADSDSNQPTSP